MTIARGLFIIATVVGQALFAFSVLFGVANALTGVGVVAGTGLLTLHCESAGNGTVSPRDRAFLLVLFCLSIGTLIRHPLFAPAPASSKKGDLLVAWNTKRR